MTTEIKSPTFPESVADGTIANWVKKEGDSVKQDEVIAEIETDKVVLEVVAPFDGVVSKVLKPAGETVLSAELIAEFTKEDINQASDAPKNEIIAEPEKEEAVEINNELKDSSIKNGPAVKKLLKEHDLNESDISGSGKNGRITKSDIVNHLNVPVSKDKDQEKSMSPSVKVASSSDERLEERVPMSRLRSTIANRLLTVKQETAMLTTFNEVDPVSYTHLTLPTMDSV